MDEFDDSLPLDGEVWVNWIDKEREKGVYRGYLVGNPRRCAVKIGEDTSWIDRAILEAC